MKSDLICCDLACTFILLLTSVSLKNEQEYKILHAAPALQ